MIKYETYMVFFDGRVQESYRLKSTAIDRAQELAEENQFVYVLDGEDNERIIWSSDDCDFDGNPLEVEEYNPYAY